MPLDLNEPHDEPLLAIVVHRRKNRRIKLTKELREVLEAHRPKSIDDVIDIDEESPHGQKHPA